MPASSPPPDWSRRTLVRSGAAAAVGAVAAGLPGSPDRVAAHNLPPGQFGSPAYDAALKASGGMKAVFQSPNIEASVVAGKTLTHLLLLQLKNWLNGFQFS